MGVKDNPILESSLEKVFYCVTETPQLGWGVKDELKAMSKKKDSP